MDWIEEIFYKWKMKLKRASLRKAMVAYMVMAVIAVLVVSVAVMQICEGWKGVIRQVNGIEDEYVYLEKGVFVINYKSDAVHIVKRDTLSLNDKDAKLYDVINAIEIMIIPLCSLCAIMSVSLLYYRNKIKAPLEIMTLEMEAIGRNDLSVSCYYDSGDEMGEVCKTMDAMRLSVIKNQKNMWNLMEEQRKVNAAFAHDLRTPLTVISGYADMLLEYYPKGTLKEEQILEILNSIQGQTARISEFSETMKDIHKFETLEVKLKKHTDKELQQEIKRLTDGLTGEQTPKISLTFDLETTSFYYDENIILEVLGNILSNALRYAWENILVSIEQREKKLFIFVKDDGRGMTKEELYKADSPYFSDKANAEENQPHFGIGLTICKILCKKHGGAISFSNSVEGGAIVCAEFQI